MFLKQWDLYFRKCQPRLTHRNFIEQGARPGYRVVGVTWKQFHLLAFSCIHLRRVAFDM